MKNNYFLIVFLIFALTFFLPTLFLMGRSFDHLEYKRLIDKGVETEAIVIKNTETSNVSISGKDYYSIEYYFYDLEGNKHFGKTTQSFILEEINKLENNGFITIKYDNKTFKSVEASYSFSASNGMDVIFFFVFGIIDSVFWTILIINLIKIIKLNNIKKKGMEFPAKFISYINTGVEINEHPMYRIYYSWNKRSGEQKIEKSKNLYTEREVLIFEEAKEFKIKVLGDQSVIFSKPTQLREQLYPNQPKLKDFENECRYCGSSYNKELKKCPKCGAMKDELK